MKDNLELERGDIVIDRDILNLTSYLNLDKWSERKTFR